MIECHQIFAAILGPLDRAAEQPRRIGNKEIFGIKFAARAEPAAHIVLHHAYRGFRQTHHLRQDSPIGERHLGRTADRHALILRVPLRYEPAWLHRHRAVPLHAKMLAPDIGRFPERRICVAADGRNGACAIGAGVLEEKNIVLACGVAIDQSRKRLDIDRNSLQRILGQRRAIGDDDRKRLAGCRAPGAADVERLGDEMCEIHHPIGDPTRS